MATGTVKWFNGEKGYGFIQPDNGGKDVFVHISAVEQAGMRLLNEGDKLTYEEVADRKSGKVSAATCRRPNKVLLDRRPRMYWRRLVSQGGASGIAPGAFSFLRFCATSTKKGFTLCLPPMLSASNVDA